ncbi:Arc family DNA-binding protein [Pusillimonas noertemannii]|uniref:Arc-like DNA binding dprotein n=1 Tax=Pusillimonas noertemannii TaxID=305977 RepID=A0A2U1CRY1_9BURK|nr:Arc family DNA-binding protein [Pusillimonas noertemannii]NYT67980.1 Arc family DNA-binding protein [Pusillimonas noertemannii]PVY68655.1 Arc-like DNA binding dprotein [Pusillimonas noertemannii]TFL11879.1 Arc family DNA-binding protein [Pusillimonas noertemannii]
MARTDPQVNFRMPQELRDKLDDAARTSGRTLTAEIVARLELTLSDISSTYGGAELRFAMMKVLRHEEFSLLLDRIHRLGGVDQVLKESASSLIKRVEGPALTGTPAEVESHYSKIVGSTPLSALLTAAEIQKIAERLDQIQAANVARTKAAKPVQTPTDSDTGPIVDRLVLVNKIRPDADRSALGEKLEKAVESVGKSRTPTIPGKNAPKRGLGSAGKSPKK